MSINQEDEGAKGNGSDLCRLLTIEEVCKLTAISRATFYRLRDKGEGPRIVYVGDSPRVLMQYFHEWCGG